MRIDLSGVREASGQRHSVSSLLSCLMRSSLFGVIAMLLLSLCAFGPEGVLFPLYSHALSPQALLGVIARLVAACAQRLRSLLETATAASFPSASSSSNSSIVIASSSSSSTSGSGSGIAALARSLSPRSLRGGGGGSSGSEGVVLDVSAFLLLFCPF